MNYLSHYRSAEVLGCEISWDCSVFLSKSSLNYSWQKKGECYQRQPEF
ncbi:hypothetical protein SLEP1_g27196 [Rubroshorea leprosula]|uniref:Uncharacterized protein n=1 Tax=Rubroshorea leprosula TaxID=152421 RepID=A0AAV5JSG1_9ROSI|nr:hypothetical protein SLEP1_g27196 [Rubroshorea leprosula]